MFLLTQGQILRQGFSVKDPFKRQSSDSPQRIDGQVALQEFSPTVETSCYGKCPILLWNATTLQATGYFEITRLARVNGHKRSLAVGLSRHLFSCSRQISLRKILWFLLFRHINILWGSFLDPVRIPGNKRISKCLVLFLAEFESCWHPSKQARISGNIFCTHPGKQAHLQLKLPRFMVMQGYVSWARIPASKGMHVTIRDFESLKQQLVFVSLFYHPSKHFARFFRKYEGTSQQA